MMERRSGTPVTVSRSGYPPQHLEALRSTRRWTSRVILISGGSAFLLGWGYFRDWPIPLFELAPFAALFACVVIPLALATRSEMRTVCLLPYFKKGGEKVQTDTFLHGKALARYCTSLDEIAQAAGMEPLSAFGFRDDLRSESLVWYDAIRGLTAVSGLRVLLQETPALLSAPTEEIVAVLDDLGRVEEGLLHAVALGVPFCFVLRHGNSASGHEMDVRQGYFL